VEGLSIFGIRRANVWETFSGVRINSVTRPPQRGGIRGEDPDCISGEAVLKCVFMLVHLATIFVFERHVNLALSFETLY